MHKTLRRHLGYAGQPSFKLIPDVLITTIASVLGVFDRGLSLSIAVFQNFGSFLHSLVSIFFHVSGYFVSSIHSRRVVD